MHWLNRWFPKRTAPSKFKARCRSFRPGLEALEDRQLLTLTAPTLLAPLNSAPPVTTFSWSPEPDALYYNFQIFNQTTNTLITAPNYSSTTLTLGSPLVAGNTYKWSVQAVDSSGNIGPWSNEVIGITNLAAPTLIGPTGPAAPQPVFSWNPLDGAVHYDIWAQNNNTRQIVRDTNVSGTSWTPPTPLAQGNTYVWWLRGVDSNGINGPWSASMNFSEAVLPPPTLIGPSGSGLLESTFSWNIVAGADHYDVWLEDVTTSQVIRDSNVGGTTWVPTSPLTAQNSYVWWARAIDPNGYAGQWSSSLLFTAYALPAPSATGPTGSAAALPTFSWSAVTGADHYDIWLQDKKAGVVVRDTNVAGTTWTPPRPLTPGDNYTWWVRAIDSDNNTGLWSTALSFTDYTLLAPSLIGPNGSSATLPTFTWNAVSGADHYDIWVQDMKTGAIMRNTNVAGTSWTPASPLLQGDTYQWWARGVDKTGLAGQWSANQSFAVAALASPTLTGPAGTAGALPTFSWVGVAGADHYDIWVKDLKTGVLVRDENVAGTTWAPPSPLPAGHSYTWWARAIDSVGSPGPWSSPLAFTAYALPAPLPVGPSGSGAVTPTFTWNAVAGADHYDIWIDDLTKGRSQVIRNQNVVGTAWTASTPLTAGDKYRWWVRAVTAANAVSAWSSPLDFSVVKAT